MNFWKKSFVDLFDRRVELVSDLFIASIKMILAHETAHVARGHWNLRIKEPEYSQMRSEFIKKSEATHPIYQFRLFCTLKHIKEHLDHMAEKSNE